MITIMTDAGVGERIALIPAYEPEELMLPLLKDVRDAGFHIIVVDDGSGDAYADLFQRAEEHADKVLSYPENRGKGYALKTGLHYIAEHYDGDFVVVTLDSDGQHLVSDAERICALAREKKDTLVLGSRELEEKVPLRSRFGNSVTRAVYRLATGVHVHDTQTGLRAFSSELLPMMLDIPGERYEYEMNVLLEFSRSKLPIEEVTIPTIYIDNNSGSHFNPVKDSYRVFKEILKFSASSLIAFCIDFILYSILSAVTGGMGAASVPFSNITARVVSATVNYTINRKFVFRSDRSVAQTAWQYFLLALIILAGNTALLYLLVNVLGMNRYWAKLLAEIVFFLLNWTIQRFVIFHKKEKSGQQTETKDKQDV